MKLERMVWKVLCYWRLSNCYMYLGMGEETRIEPMCSFPPTMDISYFVRKHSLSKFPVTFSNRLDNRSSNRYFCALNVKVWYL